MNSGLSAVRHALTQQFHMWDGHSCGHCSLGSKVCSRQEGKEVHNGKAGRAAKHEEAIPTFQTTGQQQQYIHKNKEDVTCMQTQEEGKARGSYNLRDLCSKLQGKLLS